MKRAEATNMPDINKIIDETNSPTNQPMHTYPHFTNYPENEQTQHPQHALLSNPKNLNDYQNKNSTHMPMNPEYSMPIHAEHEKHLNNNYKNLVKKSMKHKCKIENVSGYEPDAVSLSTPL